MSSYLRTTRECSFDQLQPELQQAFHNYFNEHDLGMPENLSCCETSSVKKESGWLNNWLSQSEENSFYTAILLTPQMLFWARAGAQSAPSARGARLNEVSVKVFTSIFSKDNGLEIFGIMDDSKTVMRGYIGMENQSAAEKFYAEVAQIIEKINPAPERKFPRWMGGR